MNSRNNLKFPGFKRREKIQRFIPLFMFTFIFSLVYVSQKFVLVMVYRTIELQQCSINCGLRE